MRLLIDTNIFLEILLAQERASEARALLSKVNDYQFFISDYALHSIGLILFRRGQHDRFGELVGDIVNAGLFIVALRSEDMAAVIEAARKFRLDFDDAYQYVACEKYNLTLVSLDGDFDRTERGRKQPAEILAARSDVTPAEQG